METTVDVLKQLYVILGGNTTDVENITLIPEILAKIVEIKGQAKKKYLHIIQNIQDSSGSKPEINLFFINEEATLPKNGNTLPLNDSGSVKGVATYLAECFYGSKEMAFDKIDHSKDEDGDTGYGVDAIGVSSAIQTIKLSPYTTDFKGIVVPSFAGLINYAQAGEVERVAIGNVYLSTSTISPTKFYLAVLCRIEKGFGGSETAGCTVFAIDDTMQFVETCSIPLS